MERLNIALSDEDLPMLHAQIEKLRIKSVNQISV